MRVFCLSSCDTCRKALKELRSAGHAPDVIDVRKDGIAPADLDAIVSAFGDKAVNRASATWRGLSEAERTEAPKTLIARHPALLKRPVIERDGQLYQGWKDDVRVAVLG